jgi:hypothetical protein
MNKYRECSMYTEWSLFSHKEEWNYVACRKMDRTGLVSWEARYSTHKKTNITFLTPMWNVDL